jgi:hypothetical protein
MAKYPCQVINDTGQTIWLKIIGHEPNVFWSPDLPGPSEGILFAAAPLNQIQAELSEGRRVAVAWDSTGTFVVANTDFNLSGPGTISVKNGTVTYSSP